MRYMMTAIVGAIFVAAPALGGVVSSAARETAQAVAEKVCGKAARELTEKSAEKLGREAAEQAGRKLIQEEAMSLAPRIERLLVANGEQAAPFIRKAGLEGIEALEKAGPQAGDILRLFARSGDEAMWVVAKPRRAALFLKHGNAAAEAMLRHGEVAETLIERFEGSAARALNNIEGQNARRLAMMAEDGELARIGRTGQLLDTIGRYGDRAMDFVWRNKGALTVAAALTAFLADPKPFVDGGKELSKAVVTPVAEQVARSVDWTVVILVGAGVAVLLVSLKIHRRNRRRRAADEDHSRGGSKS